MQTAKALLANFANQVRDLIEYNKTATLVVAGVAFAVGAIFF